MENRKEKNTVEVMEFVTSEKANELSNAFTNNRGRLPISKQKPKIFVFGSILDQDVLADKEYYFLVYKVAVGRSLTYKI